MYHVLLVKVATFSVKERASRDMTVAWQAQVLRFTTFRQLPGAALDLDAMWHAALGTEPDQVQTQVKRQVQVVEAEIDGVRRVLHVEPERIDWLFQPAREITESGLPELGPLTTILPDFMASVDAWLSHPEWPTARRVAIGMVVLTEADSLRSVLQTIMQMEPSLHLSVDKDIEDFLFQINRPRVEVFGNLNLRINRLTKWSAAQLVEARIQLSEAMMTQLARPRAFVVLEIDVNTPAQGQFEFSASVQQTLVQRLIALADEIIQQGGGT